MLRPTFDEIWHHVVDHSSYVRLNVTLHSMRIGGATVRHDQGTTTKEIMRLGRWTDDTINRYIRTEYLCLPSELKGIKELQTKRKYQVHSICSCRIKHQYQPKRRSVSRWKKQGLSDTVILKRMEAVTRHRIKKSHKGLSHVPQEVAEVHRLAILGYRAKPLVTPYTVDRDYIGKHFDGNEFFFTLAVYHSFKRWRRFNQMCKYQAIQELRGMSG